MEDSDVASYKIALRQITTDNISELEKAKAFLPENPDRVLSLRTATGG